ncbi:MAG: transposase [Candidatus Sulfotelmatobacter sp.]
MTDRAIFNCLLLLPHHWVCVADREKGNQWFFGMKAHVGVDSKTKIIHTAVATPAHVADSRVLPDLLHGEETRVWGDQAYRGQTEVIQECAPRAQDHTHRRYRYKNGIDEEERAKNRTKSSVRSKVEHVFQVMKLKFGFCEAALSRTEEERAPAVRDLRIGQSVSKSSEAAEGERVDESRFDGRRRRQKSKWKARSSPHYC